MSILRADNAGPSAGGTTYSLTDGVAKASVLYQQTGTPGIAKSYNVSSVDDDGAGDFGVNFTNAFATASIIPSIMTAQEGASLRGADGGTVDGNFTTSLEVGSYVGSSSTADGGRQDNAYNALTMQGDLA